MTLQEIIVLEADRSPPPKLPSKNFPWLEAAQLKIPAKDWLLATHKERPPLKMIFRGGL